MKKLLLHLASIGIVLSTLMPTTSYALRAIDEEALVQDSTYYVSDEVDCGGPAGVAIPPGSDNMQTVWNELIAIQGGGQYSDIRAAGIMGNMQTESHFDPTIMQKGGNSNNPADAGEGGYGLVQWSPGSKLIPYLHEQLPTIHAEIQALFEQLKGQGPSPETGAGQALFAATTIRDAAFSFETKYERHLGPPQPARITQAQGIWDRAKADGWVGVGATGPGASPTSTGGSCDTNNLVTTGGCTNPFAGGTFGLGRTDDGVDYTAATPQPLLAVCDMIILHSQDAPHWGPDGKFIYAKLTSGPFANKCWYYAEHLDPADMPANGARLKAGDHIATLLPGGWNLEVGFARGDRLAATSVGEAGYPSVSGIAAAKFLRSIGAPTRDDPGPGAAEYGGGSCPADVQPVQ